MMYGYVIPRTINISYSEISSYNKYECEQY